MFQPVKKVRHSGMDAGIQSQGERSEGFEAIYGAALCMPQRYRKVTIPDDYAQDRPWRWIPASMAV
jgi:hypothetical protein